MKRGIKISVCILLSSVALFCACDRELLAYDSFARFGTQTRWVYRDGEGKTKDTWEKLLAAEEEVEASVSSERAESSVSRFNAAGAGESVEIDFTAYALLQTAKEIYEKTEGAYNPATGLLVDLWGFSPRFRAADYTPVTPYDRADPWGELPQEKYVQAFRTLCDFEGVRLYEEDGKYYAQKPNVSAEIDGVTYTLRLDLGGIGKGLCVDRASAILQDAGFSYGYFNLGGSSMCVLENPKSPSGEWEVGVVHPRAAGNYMTVSAKNLSLSTSGDYELYYEIGGVRYCHIIDPFTGTPVSAGEGGIVCASVFGLSGAEGDATTTALMAMGREKAVRYIGKYLCGVQVSFVWRNGDEYVLYTNSDNYALNEEWEVVRI